MGGVEDAGAEPVIMRAEGQGVQAGGGNDPVSIFGSSRAVAGRDAIVAGRDVNVTLQPPAFPPERQIVVGNVPQSPPAFRAREGLLAQLRQAGPGVSLVCAMTGMRGVGKTQIAAAYARECMDAGWRLVAWVNAEKMPETLAGLAEVAASLGIETAGATLEQVARRVRNRLESDGDRHLLVFDNVTDATALRPYVPAGRCQVILTSTSTGTARLGKPVMVDVFTEDEALALLAESARPDDPDGARELARELGFLPLALAQAAAVIADQSLMYAVYLQRLRQFPLSDYLRPAVGEPYPRGLAEAILLSIQAATAADQTGLCGPLLDVIALLSPAGVSRELLHLAGREATPQAAGPAGVDEALGRLAAASLLTFSGDGTGVTAHRVVTRVTRERLLRDGALPARAEGMCSLLAAAWDSLHEPWLDRPAARDFVQQVTALTEHLAATLDDDSPAARCFLTLRVWAVWCLNDLADSAVQAIGLAESLVLDCTRVLGNDHPDTLGARTNLANAYQAAGRPAEAIPLHQQTLTDRTRILGNDHPDTLTSRNNLANAYRMAGRPAEAIPLHEETLADRARILGNHHPDTLTSRNNLALAYQAAGRTAEAIPLLERAIADRTRILGSDHPETLRSRSNLALAYQEAGRTAEAIPMYEAAIAGFERVLGAEHPYTVVARENLANARTAER